MRILTALTCQTLRNILRWIHDQRYVPVHSNFKTLDIAAGVWCLVRYYFCVGEHYNLEIKIIPSESRRRTSGVLMPHVRFKSIYQLHRRDTKNSKSAAAGGSSVLILKSSIANNHKAGQACEQEEILAVKSASTTASGE